MSTVLTFRIPPELEERLERLSAATDRTRSWLAVDALRSYLEAQEWQIAEIQAGIAEADRGDLAPADEVARVFERWTRA